MLHILVEQVDLKNYIVRLDFYDHFLIHQKQLSISKTKCGFYLKIERKNLTCQIARKISNAVRIRATI